MISRNSLRRSRWAAIGAALAVTFGGGGLIAVSAASSPPSSVITVDSVRVLDTRTGIGLTGPFQHSSPANSRSPAPSCLQAQPACC